MGCPLSSSITSNAHKKGSPTCLSLVVAVVVYDSCPWSVLQSRSPTRSSLSLFSRSDAEVPQIQSSTELNDNLVATWVHFLAHFAPFFGLLRDGLSPGVRGFFEPSTMKNSSSSRAPLGGGVAGSLTPR